MKKIKISENVQIVVNDPPKRGPVILDNDYSKLDKKKRIETGFTYKGYTFNPDLEIGDDEAYLYHDVTTPSGQTIMIDWTGYGTTSSMTEYDFCLWVDLGRPRREDADGHSPLDRKALESLIPPNSILLLKKLKQR
jgi:hypothetical protein